MSRQLDEYKVYSDIKLKLKYDILNKLGEGCFGTIFKAISKTKNRQIALKLQFHDVFEDSKARSNLSNEIAILERLKGLKGIPKLYGAGKWGHGYYMEIELLTSSLHDEKTKMYSELQIWNITSELIQILQSIHNRGIVHQDLKPQNIMKDGKGALYIIDYGLSSLFNYDVHEKSKKTGFVGTPRYASLAAHEGYLQKPKDDLQSLLYVMGAIHLKKAPWFELKGPPSQKLQRIQKYKEANSMAWFKKCGQPFAVAYEYLTDLAYDNEVNYEYVIGLFQSARRSMALQTVKITRPQLQGMKNSRHNSEKVSSIRKSPIKPPQITINLVQQPKPIRSIKKRNTLSTKLDQDESEQQNNFSQVAQDGYMELLQILTEKLLGNEDNLGEEEDAVVNSICGREPRINNIAKYEALLFKNPFTIA